MYRRLAETNPQRTLRGSAAGMPAISEGVASKAGTGRRT